MTGRRLVAASESAPVGVDPSHDRAAGAVSEAVILHCWGRAVWHAFADCTRCPRLAQALQFLRRKKRAMTVKSCPTPSKIAYASKTAANGAKHVGSNGKRLRAYRCDCTKWHLASWAPIEFGE